MIIGETLQTIKSGVSAGAICQSYYELELEGGEDSMVICLGCSKFQEAREDT